jgi:hypothetical protein
MATGLFDTDTRSKIYAPVITGSDDHGTSFSLSFDDGGGQESDVDWSDSPQPQQDSLTPDRRPAFLHPGSAGSLRPPSPQSSFLVMASEDGANGGAAPALKNPFNFQTQVISTSPVKSVRFLPGGSQPLVFFYN